MADRRKGCRCGLCSLATTLIPRYKTGYPRPVQPDRKRGDFYTWHTDAGPTTYPDGTIRKLSCTIQLSDPDEYEGGHFQWLDATTEFDRMQDSSTINMTNAIQTVPFSMKQKGTIILFPSFLHHQVTPVLRGQRKSLVTWFIGPPYA